MSIERKIMEQIGLLKKKKIKNIDNKDSEKDITDQVNNVVKKISYVVFFVVIAYAFFSGDGLKKITENIADNNNFIEDKGEEVKNSEIEQESYTIVPKKFIDNINYKEYIVINLTGDSEYIFSDSKGRHVKLIDLKFNIENLNNIESLDLLDRDNKYLILIKDIVDISTIKEVFQEKKFKKVYFNLI